MSKTDLNEKSRKANLESIAAIIATVQQYPAEADGDIKKIRIAISEEFSPGSPYEEYLTEEIIQRILEIKRQRKIRNSVLDEAFEEATRTALNLTRDDCEETALYCKIISNDRRVAANDAIDRQLSEYGTSLDHIQLNAYRSVALELENIDRRLDLLEKKLRHLQQSLRDMQVQRRRLSD